MVSVRLDETDVNWLKEYAEKYRFHFRGKSCVSKVIKHLIRMEKEREEAQQTGSIKPISEDSFWKRYSEYAELMERGSSHFRVAREIGLLTSPPEVERAYRKRYMDMKRAEKEIAKEEALSILRPYLDRDTLKYLNRLTTEPAPWIANAVKQKVDFVVDSFRYWLKHPESRRANITERALMQFLK